MKFIQAFLSGAIVLAIAIWLSSPRGTKINAEDYGDRWPFHSSSARILCGKHDALIVAVNGVEYAANGMALTHYDDLSNVSHIVRLDPKYAANPELKIKVGLGAIFEVGEKICK